MLRRTAAAIAAAIAAALVAASCSASHSASSANAENQWVDSTLAKMNLQEKVGQLFVINCYGISVRDLDPMAIASNQSAYGVNTCEQVLDKYHPGGLYFFEPNYLNPLQLVGLANGVQQVAMTQRVAVPVFTSADDEGGTVQHLNSPAALFPGNMGLGAVGDSGTAGDVAGVMGQEMRAMGVDAGFAPVVDVNTNQINQADGARSYSDRTDVARRFASAQVKGFQESHNVAATAKHFPGLGSVTVDTDSAPGTSDRTPDQLRSIDLPTFEAAIKAGVQTVMTNYATYPNIDPSGLPAALSHMFVTDMLRNQLHFQGVIITDYFGAGALAPLHKTPAQLAVMALDAGDDQLLPLALGTPPTTNLDGAYNGIIQAVQSGQIPESRVDESVRRILRLKWWLGLVQHPYQDPANVSRVVGTDSHIELSGQTAQDSMNLLKNDNRLLPLDAKKTRSVFVTGWAEPTLPSVDTVANQVALKGPHVSALATGTTPTPQQITQAAAAAKQSDVTIVLTYNVWNPTQLNSPQENLVQALVQTGKPVVVIAQGAPYDVAYMPNVAAFLNAWSYQPTALMTATDVLFGDVDPHGKLPVTITEPPPSTKVVYPFGFGLSYP